MQNIDDWIKYFEFIISMKKETSEKLSKEITKDKILQVLKTIDLDLDNANIVGEQKNRWKSKYIDSWIERRILEYQDEIIRRFEKRVD